MSCVGFLAAKNTVARESSRCNDYKKDTVHPMQLMGWLIGAVAALFLLMECLSRVVAPPPSARVHRDAANAKKNLVAEMDELSAAAIKTAGSPSAPEDQSGSKKKNA